MRPPKKAQPLNLRQRSEKPPPLSPENGGGVLLPHRKKKPAPAGELFPENKKAGCPRCTPNDCCKNHIFLSGVPKRTPHPPPGFFNPLRCFSLRRACPTQPRREDFRTPQAPPPNRRLCGLPHRLRKIRRPAVVFPKTKKVRFCGLSLNRRKAPGGQTGAFHS